jgi:hypothetical protein
MRFSTRRVIISVVCCVGLATACSSSNGLESARPNGSSVDALTGGADGQVAPAADAPGPTSSEDAADTVDSGPLDSSADGPAADTAPDGGDLQPIRVIRGASDRATWFDLTLVGSGLGAHEGAVVSARIGHPDRPPERLGSGQARITGGAFQLLFPDVLEPDLYKAKYCSST